MSARQAFALSVLVVLGGATARATDPNELRELARPPLPACEWNLVFDDRLCCALPGDVSGWAAEAASIRAALCGDARDADRHFRLGECYEHLAGDEQARASKAWHVRVWGPPFRNLNYHRARQQDFRRLARDAFARAADLYRLQIDQHADDRRLRLRLGQALDGAGRHADAEELLRQVAGRESDNWQAWAALGRCLEHRYEDGLQKGEHAEQASDALHQVGWRLAGRRPADAFYAKVRLNRDEARSCFDRAVQLAPDRPEPYLFRAHLGFALAVRVSPSAPTDIHDTLRRLKQAAPEFLEDVRRAADRDPANVRLLTSLALLEVITATAPARLGETDLLASLAEPARGRPLEVLRRLEAMADGPDTCEALALLRLLVQADAARALELLQRAAAVRPQRDLIWDLVVAWCEAAGRFDDAIKAGQARLRSQDSLAGRLALAATLYRAGQLDAAEGQVRAAWLLQPTDLTANLFRAALLLKRGNDAAARAEAERCLGWANKALSDESPAALQHDFALLHAIYLGLDGRPWQAEQECKRGSAFPVDPAYDREVRRALRSH